MSDEFVDELTRNLSRVSAERDEAVDALAERADDLQRLREALEDIAEQTARSTTLTQLDVNRIAAAALQEDTPPDYGYSEDGNTMDPRLDAGGPGR